MADHTPTPWQISDVRTVDDTPMIVGGAGFEFGLIADVTEDFDAAFIVKAVNSHDALVKALEEVAYPIKAMQSRLKPDEKIDGVMAVALADNAEYLRSIALRALAALREVGR